MVNKKYSLKLNDFQQNLINSFSSFKISKSFTDVTLISSDEQRILAHQVILSSSSDYFHNLLLQNPHANPLIILDGVYMEELSNVVNFMYNGEVKIEKEKLPQFLEVAKKFGLKGIDKELVEDILPTTKKVADTHDILHTKRNGFVGVIKSAQHILEKAEIASNNFNEKSTNNGPTNYEIPPEKTNGTIIKLEKEDLGSNLSLQRIKVEPKVNEDDSGIKSEDDKDSFKYHNFVCNMTMDEIRMKSDKLYRRQNDEYHCNVCGYVSPKDNHMREHAEIHIAGLKFQCPDCKKLLTTRKNARSHKRNHPTTNK